jgi:HD-GYP domain-containing protein (c-di-GMP phosphodiesterase class II)
MTQGIAALAQGEGAHHKLAVTAQLLTQLMEAHDEATAAHMRRVGALASQLGQQLGMDGPSCARLRWGGQLHDIGKLAISPVALRRPGPLLPHERQRIAQHPQIGVFIVQPFPATDLVTPIIRAHHERVDGSGYPDGLVGAAIPLATQVVAVADAFDAMTNPRPYQALLSPQDALAAIRAQAGQLWDTTVVAALADCVAPPLAERAVGASRAAYHRAV